MLKEEKFSHEGVQQSDYIYLWNSKSKPQEELGIYSRFKTFIRENDLIYEIALHVHERFTRSINTLSKHNPNLVKINFRHLLGI